jgi:hypothetical protein
VVDAPDLDHPVSHILDFRGKVVVVLLVISSISFEGLPFCLFLVLVVDGAEESIPSKPPAVAPTMLRLVDDSGGEISNLDVGDLVDCEAAKDRGGGRGVSFSREEWARDASDTKCSGSE